MNIENIDLNIGGGEFGACLVNFEYEFSDKGSMVQPPYPESLTIYRVQFILANYDKAFWCDLQEQHFCMVESQVLDWIHKQQDEADTELKIQRLEHADDTL